MIDEDGILWGRGALDTKITFNGVLSAANHLISKGFEPEQDLYFAFSGGEEVNGPGAVRIVDWFKAQGITPPWWWMKAVRWCGTSSGSQPALRPGGHCGKGHAESPV